jgi:CPA2 family monovalent cation:H+ antiporter-2
MTGSRLLIELVIVLGTAAVVTVAFQALALPVVLGYILAGLLIGPHLPVPLVANASLVHVLSELGVILLMFTVGLELRLSAIARLGLPAAVVTLTEVGLVIAVGTLVARLTGLPDQTAVLAGACLGISSTMLVAKAFEELGLRGALTELVYSILVFEDLIAIVLLAILAGVTSGVGLAAPDVLLLIGKLAGLLAGMLAAGMLVVPRAIRWIARRARPETLLISALAVCFALAGTAASAGYSVALGAFVGGMLVAESGEGEGVARLVRPIRDVFAMVFFVSIGMTIDPAMLASEAPRIAALTAVVLVMKPIGITLGATLAGHGVRTAARAGLSLAQIGELSFVIAGIAGDPRLLAIAVGVSCVTTLTSPLLIRRSERIAARAVARLPRRVSTFVSFYEGWLARLRDRDPSLWARRFRKPLIVLVADAAATIAIIIAGATLGPRALHHLGVTDWLGERAAGIALLVVEVAVTAPFVVGMVRRVSVIARRLAAEVIPGRRSERGELDPVEDAPPSAAREPLDLGHAPRRALVLTFEVAIGLAVAVPIVAAIQPFVPASLAVIVVAAVGIALAMRRSIADFEGHVRAGSELILELLASGQAAREPASLAQVEAVLPGFGGTTPHALGAGAAAIGRTLAELDLRARTGATVLAIARGGGGVATPSPSEPLQRGDVLALAGSAEAIAAAQQVLDGDPAAAPPAAPEE